MSEKKTEPMSWGKIIAITIGVAFILGMSLGGLSSFFQLPSSLAGHGVGIGIGLTSVALLSRRRDQIQENQAQKEEQS